jgi:hypothetical protein
MDNEEQRRRVLASKDGAKGAKKKAMETFLDRNADDEFERRRNKATPKYGPGYKKGGRVTPKKKGK